MHPGGVLLHQQNTHPTGGRYRRVWHQLRCPAKCSADVQRWLCLSVLLLPLPLLGAGVGHIDPPSSAVLDGLHSMTASLRRTAPARFVLNYQGPVVKPFGPLCYRFAGYNETCRSLPDGWLTPATEVALYAPGGVPLDLLDGYQLLVRFPYWSETVFQPTLLTEPERKPDTHE